MTAFFCRSLFMLALLSVLAPPTFSADFKLKKDGSVSEQPLVIKSDSLEIDNEKKTVTFTGNVDARRDDWVMKCNKMILFYNEQQTTQGGSGKEKVQVDRIMAEGGVQIRHSSGGEASAEEAIYYQDEEKVVLTGKPVVKQGDDFVEGSKITLFLKENRSVVEGSEGNKVRAVIAPRSGQR